MELAINLRLAWSKLGYIESLKRQKCPKDKHVVESILESKIKILSSSVGWVICLTHQILVSGEYARFLSVPLRWIQIILSSGPICLSINQVIF